jgi:uncharacterized protein YbjQ (UPF0145 family)
VIGGERDSVGFFDEASDGLRGDRDEQSGDVMPGLARLSELADSGLFTSTLTPNELALLVDLGPEPVAQVLGTSVFQVGWQYLPAEAQWSGSDLFCSLDVVSRAWEQARRNAFNRLRAEARAVGADAVVGVQLRRGEHDWARRCVDFVINGTAIRLPGGSPATPSDPALSDLSVQEYWKLIGDGWSPTGLVATTAVFFVSQGFGTRWRRRASIMKNQELLEFSEAFSAARRTAVAQLRSQAKSAGADGVVGVSFDYQLDSAKIRVRGVGRGTTGVSPATLGMGADLPSGGADKRSGMIITVQAAGTAIRRAGAANQGVPQMLINLGGIS